MATTALERYEKKQLATLPLEKLTRAVDGFVRTKFKDLNKAYAVLKKAETDYSSYEGDDISELKRLKGAIVSAQRSVDSSVKAVNDYIEEQRAMFVSKKLNPDMVYKWAIVPVGEVLASGVERCRMIQRKLTFEPFDLNDESCRSVNATISAPSESAGVLRDQHRGKYNDGGFLIYQAACGIDHSEINGTDN